MIVQLTWQIMTKYTMFHSSYVTKTTAKVPRVGVISGFIHFYFAVRSGSGCLWNSPVVSSACFQNRFNHVVYTLCGLDSKLAVVDWTSMDFFFFLVVGCSAFIVGMVPGSLFQIRLWPPAHPVHPGACTNTNQTRWNWKHSSDLIGSSASLHTAVILDHANHDNNWF